MDKREFSHLKAYLWRWSLWLRLRDSLTGMVWGAAVGLGVGLALALAARLWPWLPTGEVMTLAGLLTGAGAALGTVTPWLRPRPLRRLAWLLDRRLGLAERLTTAWEIRRRRLRTTPTLARLQLADALRAARAVDIRSRLPLRAPRRGALLFLTLAVALAVSLYLPNPQDEVLRRRAAVAAAIEEQVAALEEARAEVAQAEGLTEAEREALLQALDEAIAVLDESPTTPEEAVAALSEAERSLAELQDPGAAAVQEGLSRAAEGMADSELTQGIAEALAAGEYQQAAAMLSSFAGTKGEALTREQELELARELAQAAEAVADSDPALAEQFARAAAAIESGDIAEARAAIQEAARQMGAAGQRIEGQQAVESALSQLQEGRGQIAAAGGGQEEGQLAGGAQGGQAGQGRQGGQTGPGGAGNQDGQAGQAGHSEDAGTGAPYSEIYAPERIGAEGTPLDIGREGEGGPTTGSGSLATNPGQPTVPYQEVYAAYAEQAGAALEGSYIPLGMKQYVRDYFSSLEPEP